MIKHLKKKLNPECYQRSKNNSNHFEGWYFKIVDKTGHHSYAIIPGIFISKNNVDSHSFIQIFDGIHNKSYYHKFSVKDFHSRDCEFEIHINSNYFSSNKFVLNINNSSFKISGELNFSDLTMWPKTLISPGIMGWYTWVPLMECYHGIISIDHKIQGSLLINDQKADFSNGRGYMEKDWGKSFPKAWIWCQSNHFSTLNVSFTGSIAIVPWLRKPFLGFIFGLWHNGTLYRFTTYSGAKLIHLQIDDKTVFFVIKQKSLTLKVTANQAKGGSLQAPTINGMTHSISETLKSTIEIKLIFESISGNRTIFDERGIHAGLEVGGYVQDLLAMHEKTNRK